MNNAEVYERVTERVMTQLRKGVVPWAKPWDAAAGGRPMRISVGKPYEGINVLLLAMESTEHGYSSPWWGTFDQWAAKTGLERRTNSRGHKYWADPAADGLSKDERDQLPRKGILAGQTSTKIVFAKTVQFSELDETTGETVRKSVPMLRFYSVFNAEQVGNVPGKYLPKSAEFEPVAEIQEPQTVLDKYLANGGPQLRHVAGDRAYYRMDADEITLPRRDQFTSPEAYYGTAFHEAGHSTGHKDRLSRAGIAEFDHFGTGKYAREELVAQMTSAMLQATTGIESDAEFTRTVGYVENWLGALSKDHSLVPQAASQASRAADHVLGIERHAEPEE